MKTGFLGSLIASTIVWVSLTGQDRPAQDSPSPVVRVDPVDEAARSPSFVRFRQLFIAAVGAHDAAAVLAMTEQTIRRDFQNSLPEPGRASDPSDSTWTHLKDLLALGGAFTTNRGVKRGRDEFCAPYVYSSYPYPLPDALSGGLDPWVILTDSAAVRLAPSLTAPVVASLDHQLVKAMAGKIPSRPGPGPTWAVVQLPSIDEGYVLDTEIRSPDDYHACFAEIDGEWMMVRFQRGLSPAYRPRLPGS